MKRTIVMLVASLVATVAFAAKFTNDTPLAKVNGDPVTGQDLLDAFTNRHAGHAKFLGGQNEAREFLRILIDERLFIHEGYNIGLDQDPEVVESLSAFEKAKAAETLVSAEIDTKAKVSEDEVKEAWKSLNFVIDARQVVVDTRQEADEIRAAVLRSGDLESFARTCSRAQSSAHGGKIVANWGPYGPEWETIVFALKPGEISPVMQTRDGYEVVIVDDRVDVTPPEFEKVRGDIEVVLHQRKLDQRKRDFSEELWKKFGVAIEPVDLSPASLARTLATAPDTVIAKWNNGGSMTVKEIFNDRELKMFAMLPPVRAQYEIDNRIRQTVNEPLAGLEALDRKLNEAPALATEIEKYRDVLVENTLFREHVFKDVKMTDDDVRKYYDAHKVEFFDPEQRRVAQIMVSTEKDAVSVREKLAAGADFEQMAKQFSRDFLTAGSGGDLGWITPDKVSPAFIEVLSLSVGSISRPIQSPNGWHIIKVLEIKPRRQLSFDEVKPKVREKVRSQKEHEAQGYWCNKLRAAAKIEIDDAAIKTFVVENQFKGEAPPQHVVK